MKKLALTLLLIPVFFQLPATAETVGQVPGRDDLTIVRDGWKYGIINSRGTQIIPCLYESILPLKGSDSHFVVSKGGRFGLADDRGVFILPVRYSYIRPELMGNKVLIQTGGIPMDEMSAEITLNSNDPLYLSIKNGTKTVRVPYMEAERTKWLPTIKRFVTGGKWGLADIRPNVAPIPPSYDIVGTVSDESRYIVMGCTINDGTTFNIYDTQKESFILPLKEKVQYTSILLLRGGYALVNNGLVSLSNPEVTISGKKALSLITDLNDSYFLAQSGKTPVLVVKTTGKATDLDRSITRYKINTATRDFALEEGGKWVLFSNGTRTPGLQAEPTFYGNFAIDLTKDAVKIMADGRPVAYPQISTFLISKDYNTLYYINSASKLVALNYPTMAEKVICEKCSGFSLSEDYRYMSVRVMDGWNEKAGVYDLENGAIAVPCEYEEAAMLRCGYYVVKKDGKFHIKRFEATDFDLECLDVRMLTFPEMPYCWVAQSSTQDGYALYSMKDNMLLTEYAYTPVVVKKAAGVVLSLGYDFIPYAQQSKVGFMLADGTATIEPSFDEIFLDLTEGFVKVRKDGKTGLVNPYTRAHIPCIFQETTRFSEGRCFVKKNDLWGIAGCNGEVLVPNRYKSVGDYFEDLPWLKKENFTQEITYGVTDSASNPQKVEWVNGNGELMCRGVLATPMIANVISDPLWDF